MQSSEVTQEAVMTTMAPTGLFTQFISTAAAMLNGTVATVATLKDVKQQMFTTPDYVIFAISLALPVVVGVFFFLKDLKTSTTQSFLMGERSINFIAVALSILASNMNGIFVIGVPAEMHYFGTRMALKVVGILLTIIVVSHVFAAKYQGLKFTSAYEYVERRYNYPTRVVASLLFTVSVMVYLAVVLYVPSLAFAQVTGLNIYITIVFTGVICTVYTTIGGIKAVVWADAIQMIILLVGLIVIAALGSKQAGGGERIWQIAKESGRINFDEYSPDPRTRHTLWTQMFGQFIVYLGLFISNQMMVQRYMAVATKRQAQATLYIFYILFIPLAILVAFIGLALHASYYNCEPLLKGSIKTGDQILPHYIMDLLGEYHGVPGLLTASIFAAALSSVSAVCNSLAAVWLEDFVIPGCKRFKNKTLTDRQKKFTAVGLVIFFGMMTIALSFLASSFTSKLIQATGTIWGVLGGPLGGIFIMGFFLPFCNSAGAISGIIGGLSLALWTSIGSIINAPAPATLKLIPDKWNWTLCLTPAQMMNLTALLKKPTVPPPDFPLMNLYRVSYAWYGVIGMGTCIIVGIIVSLGTIWFKKCRPRLEKELLCLCCCLSFVLGLDKGHVYEFDNKAQVAAADNDNDDIIVVQSSYKQAESVIDAYDETRQPTDDQEPESAIDAYDETRQPTDDQEEPYVTTSYSKDDHYFNNSAYVDEHNTNGY